jgi:DNA-binding NtrC family response regulator
VSQAESLEDLERVHIKMILDKYDWNISRAARALNVDRVTLYNKISKYGLRQAQ